MSRQDMNRWLIWTAVLLCWLHAPAAVAVSAMQFKVMTWNIWKGGRMDGDEAGPRKVIEVIRTSGADIVALQETYGSGERIADALGWHFHPRGTNVSILSRYPIIEDISVFEEFKCVGALIELPESRRVAFYSIWLPYDAEIWEPGTRDHTDIAGLLAACASSAVDLKTIRDAIEHRLADARYAGVPVVIAGDFNSMSHLDYAEIARDQYKAAVNWPTSRVLIDAGYRDAWREMHPHIDRAGDRTWTPRFPEQEQDRIDFIYYRGEDLNASAAGRIDEHPAGFPSDHAAVIAEFNIDAQAERLREVTCRIATYNIRHGRGMDDVVNLDRTADALLALNADVIGLQEVDDRVKRSGGVNQAAELGRRLNMHAAFGSFMDHQGGRYGMGILSRYPLRNVQSIVLPVGNEPRVALAAEVRLPTGESMMIVNVHFDWVADDGYRFAQAKALAQFLRELTMPFVLLGDFNDQPGSRTLQMFTMLALEARKPADNRMTFSSTKPEEEIDFIFLNPESRWSVKSVIVIDDPMTSDHRAVLTEGVLHAK